jgi:hypothetical protein
VLVLGRRPHSGLAGLGVAHDGQNLGRDREKRQIFRTGIDKLVRNVGATGRRKDVIAGAERVGRRSAPEDPASCEHEEVLFVREVVVHGYTAFPAAIAVTLEPIRRAPRISARGVTRASMQLPCTTFVLSARSTFRTNAIALPLRFG